MPRRDAEKIGPLSALGLRLRLGRGGGLRPLASARLFEPILREVVEMASLTADDNTVLLGAADLRPIPWIAPRCRQLLVVDDLPDPELSRMEKGENGRGVRNVRFQWGTAAGIAAPQYTTDRLISLNFLFRARDPRLAIRQILFTCRHDAIVVCCEPSASLDSRTARKFSREAELSMEEHRALVAYSRAAAAHRGFTREGLTALLSEGGLKEIEIREMLHGLVVAARCRVRL